MTEPDSPAARPEPPQDPAPPRDQPLPVTLLTGFLGAGKTTLLNRLLDEARARDPPLRVAVLENEFGLEFGLERALLTDDAAADVSEVLEFRELSGGCICCSVRAELIGALERLALERERFDAVVVETTGLADPRPVVSALEAAAPAGLRLATVVTVVDAGGVLDQLAEPKPAGVVNEAEAQLGMADVVVLNKLDQAAPGAREAVAAVNGGRGRVLEARFCEGEGVAAAVLDARGFDVARWPGVLEQRHSAHDPAIETVGLLAPAGQRADEAAVRAQAEAWVAGGALLRAKGVFACADGRRWVLQAVRESWTLERGSAAAGGSQVVFIGRGVLGREAELRGEFEALFAA